MRLHVDADRCQGHNRCCALAPELFETDTLGYATPVHGGDVPPELEAKARLCIDNCPEFAISSSDEAAPRTRERPHSRHE